MGTYVLEVVRYLTEHGFTKFSVEIDDWKLIITLWTIDKVVSKMLVLPSVNLDHDLPFYVEQMVIELKGGKR